MPSPIASPGPTAPASAAPGHPTSRRAAVLGRAIVALIAGLGLVSLAVVLVVSPGGIVLSSDPGAPTVPLWVVLLPPAAVVAVALAVPRPGALPVVVRDARRATASTWLLVACAAAFTGIAGVPGVAGGELYVLAKAVVLVAIPAVVVAALRGGVAFDRAPASRWWVPLLLVAVWVLLAKVAPWNPRSDYSGYDPALLLVAGLATALTAGVGEELLYRRWLQTRLEALLGAWPGIALASLAFSLMHVGSHGGGDWWVDIATAVVAQGPSGLMLGILWWRFRLLWPLITIHVLMNGWEIVPAILG